MITEIQEIQRYGRNKNTVINKKYIESGEYRKKFNNISSDPTLNRMIYIYAKKMLKHRSGTMLEDMCWIDIDSLEIVASETDQQCEGKISYSKSTRKAIKKHEHLLAMHTHPNSMPPSINDFNSAFTNDYSIALVLCHDGKIYIYNSSKKVNESLHNATIKKYLSKGYSDLDAQLLALSEVKEKQLIAFKEVI